MKLIGKHNDLRFEIIEDFPEVGFYLYIFDKNDNCIADYLQNSEQIAKEFALAELGIPFDSWMTTD